MLSFCLLLEKSLAFSWPKCPDLTKHVFIGTTSGVEFSWEEMVGPRMSWALFVVLNLGEALSEAGGYKN